ncbi:hypothetical protein N658DRAFT_126271 [Parathielavia hyrcaniae]|uniref:Uncharacterized protein n=1 Tax=Parathielavia hyrcaniae TaxID=113614 RepID=A0AAN6T6A2_9PEZI|nr:hypothetical protein N658DRAFT_126271 [Parathielavia hyrcaniae]
MGRERGSVKPVPPATNSIPGSHRQPALLVWYLGSRELFCALPSRPIFKARRIEGHQPTTLSSTLSAGQPYAEHSASSHDRVIERVAWSICDFSVPGPLRQVESGCGSSVTTTTGCLWDIGSLVNFCEALSTERKARLQPGCLKWQRHSGQAFCGRGTSRFLRWFLNPLSRCPVQTCLSRSV